MGGIRDRVHAMGSVGGRLVPAIRSRTYYLLHGARAGFAEGVAGVGCLDGIGLGLGERCGQGGYAVGCLAGS